MKVSIYTIKRNQEIIRECLREGDNAKQANEASGCGHLLLRSIFVLLWLRSAKKELAVSDFGLDD
jgi:hypothetical protein